MLPMAVCARIADRLSIPSVPRLSPEWTALS